jgi:hypothetical protein
MNVRTDTGPRRHRLTVDEHQRLAEVGVLAPDARVELIDGAIIDMAPIGSRHAATTAFLAIDVDLSQVFRAARPSPRRPPAPPRPGRPRRAARE